VVCRRVSLFTSALADSPFLPFVQLSRSSRNLAQRNVLPFPSLPPSCPFLFSLLHVLGQDEQKRRPSGEARGQDLDWQDLA